MGATSADGRDLVLYWVYFRQGLVEADVTTFAAAADDDQGELALALAQQMQARIQDATKQ